MSRLRTFSRPVAPLTPDMVGDDAYERFASDPRLPLLPVIGEDGLPVGLIERNACLTKLAGHYGRAVYGRRPVSLLMDAAPLIAEGSTSASDFAASALRDHAGQVQQGFVVVEQGAYAGVGSLVDLLHATVTERSDAIDSLRGLATDLRDSNLELARHRRLVDAVIEHIPMLVAVRSRGDGRILLINRIGAAMLGVAQADLVGRRPREVAPVHLARQLADAARMFARQPDAGARDVPFVPRPGAPARTLRIAEMPIDMPGDEPLALVVAEDVTEVRRAAGQIAHLAHFDTLTGLPNRAQWQARLSAMLATAAGAPPQLALLAIDLDRFKPVNDTHGHLAGDAVLREVARRLRAVVRAGDMPARLGGDEFAIVIAGPDAAAAAARTADALIAIMRAPVSIGAKSVEVGVSIGIAVAPEDAAVRDDLIKFADVALYRAKAEGKGVWRRFSEDMLAGLARRNALETDLRHALDRGEMAIHVQPQYDLRHDRISGFECLMRWQHPVYGAISPATFIPLAEETGLIVPLGEWAIRRACEIAAGLPDDVHVAVNVSGLQFERPGLVACVALAVAQTGIAPGQLELEITESVLMSEDEQVMRTVGLLRELGVRTALDDFGTGYASFAYLRRFPFDRVKLDRGFVRGLPGERTSRAIVAAMAVLAAQLGATITAEGVEDEAQLACLRELGCSDVQGYLIGEPGPDPAVWLTQERAASRA